MDNSTIISGDTFKVVQMFYYAVTAVAIVVGVAVIQLMNLLIARRSDRKNRYVSLLDGIIDLKMRAMASPEIMKFLPMHQAVIELIEKDKAVQSVNELMEKCIIFYHLEKIYYLSIMSGISEPERRGYKTELQLWLSVPSMDDFFNKFCSKHNCYSEKFVVEVKKTYLEMAKSLNT